MAYRIRATVAHFQIHLFYLQLDFKKEKLFQQSKKYAEYQHDPSDTVYTYIKIYV